MMPSWVSVFCTFIAFLIVRATSKSCFEFPKGADYAPLIPPTTKWVKEDTETDAKVDISPLFTKPSDTSSPLPRVAFFDIQAGSLEVSFDIPHALPLLGRIRIVGEGHFRVTIQDRYTSQNSETQELHGAVEYVAYGSKEKTEADVVTIKGLQAGAFLTDLKFFASDRVIDDSWEDEYDDEAKGGGGDYDQPDWEQHDTTLPDVVGCACVGWPKTGGRGSTCGEWDDDCRGIGWCYIKPNACNDSRPSTQFSHVHWSCQPCNNGTVPSPMPASSSTGPSTTAPKSESHPSSKQAKPKPEPTPADCGNCTGSLVIGIFGGLAVGVVLAVVVIHRQRPVRAPRRLDPPSDDENVLGHHD